MAKTKAEKRKAKRKVKLKEKRNSVTTTVRSEKADFFYCESGWFRKSGNYEKALVHLKKAIKLDPDNKLFLVEMVHLGYDMANREVQLSGLLRLYDSGQMDDEYLPLFLDLLAMNRQYRQAIEVAAILLPRIAGMKNVNKRKLRTATIQIQEYCRHQLEYEQVEEIIPKKAAIRPSPPKNKTPSHPPIAPAPQEHKENKNSVPNIPVDITMDDASFQIPLSSGRFMTCEQYELALEGHRIRFRDSFENLICLSGLHDVRSLWYQEETARKVLKSFRGRALLSDEVGLGKTIEASIILKEYIQRGIVKSALILTPSTLVSQWQEELHTKFGLNFPSTDDADFHKKGVQFWEAPYILASINQAKSKRNISAVIQREYDLVIVDEAHHLKNRNTLNWKLVNSLKKRFLLLLTATPVENNLMELYNLITLLKPGQLKTSSAFRNEFMTIGDPTGPQNRGRLKELLGQVMIRNTRALAKIEIPPRFAQTIRVKPGVNEITLYTRITDLVHHINETDRNGNKLLLKNLLSEAGSSPVAVELTLQRLLEGRDFLWDHEQEIRAIHNMCRTMGDTEKNRVLLNLIRSTKGKKIVFVNYLGTLDHLAVFLSRNDISHAVFHGRMDNRQKDEEIRSFREEKDILVTTEIGGEGRNLQFCHQMINYDLPWNPMKIEQRIGRIHRLGQQNDVMIYNLCAAESIEDYILEILDRKINMFEMVIGEIDMILGRIRDEKDFSDMVFDIWTNSLSKKERQHGFDQLAARLQRTKTQYEKTRELDEKLFGVNYEL
ncbi:MAG: SNF2-related protein [Pseudomonadota bacterium]